MSKLTKTCGTRHPSSHNDGKMFSEYQPTFLGFHQRRRKMRKNMLRN